MQYSPNNAIPYISIVDAGTIELVRSMNVEIVSSADLVGKFEAHLSQQDLDSHIQAGERIQQIKDQAFKHVKKTLKAGNSITETELQSYMHQLMKQADLIWDSGPIIGVNEHAADPHYEPATDHDLKIKKGDLLLIDVWAKINSTHSIYYDITWMGYVGNTVPDNLNKIFKIVLDARDAAVEIVRKKFAQNNPVYGWQVDNACRQVIVDKGYGDYFTHRTGHNIGQQVHGNGVNIDNLETKDERQILPGTCFSIEPGIYLPEEKMGFRSEINVYVTDSGEVQISGAVQNRIIPILA